MSMILQFLVSKPFTYKLTISDDKKFFHIK